MFHFSLKFFSYSSKRSCCLWVDFTPRAEVSRRVSSRISFAQFPFPCPLLNFRTYFSRWVRGGNLLHQRKQKSFSRPVQHSRRPPNRFRGRKDTSLHFSREATQEDKQLSTHKGANFQQRSPPNFLALRPAGIHCDCVRGSFFHLEVKKKFSSLFFFTEI